MSKAWSDVDAYIAEHLMPADASLAGALAANEAAGLPAIDVSPPQGKFLHILARLVGARRVLEIGTLGGYSTIWLARALPEGGQVVTLEVSAHHARTAAANIAEAGLSHLVTIHVGAALETLPSLPGDAPFDLIFIDADKRSNPFYFDWALKLSHTGSVIVVDNVVRDGMVLDAATTDPDIQGIRRFFGLLGNDPRVTATALQTVGGKGWDGFAFAIVN